MCHTCQESHHNAQGYPACLPHLWREINSTLNIQGPFQDHQILQKEFDNKKLTKVYATTFSTFLYINATIKATNTHSISL